MKNFRPILGFLLLMTLYVAETYSQSISFIHPNNGELKTGLDQYCTQTSVWVGCDLGYTPSSFPPGISIAQAVILYANGHVYDSRNTHVFGYDFYLTPGTYTFTAELWELFIGKKSYERKASTTITFYVKHTLAVSNNFGSGSINVDNNTVASGFTVSKYTGDALSIGAIDQNDGAGYNRIWNTSGTNNSNWKKILWKGNGAPMSGATTRNYNYTVASNDNGASIIADLKKVCDISFQNNFVGEGNGGAITISGNQYNSPASGFSVIEQNSISATANSQTINGIIYNFNHWSDGSTQATHTFYPGDHTTYTAYFSGVPSNQGKNLYNETTANRPIKLHWTDNPNPNVTQYQIWRIVRHNGVAGNPRLITTVGRGVQTYTDPLYVYTSGYTDDLLWYDVRQYYSTEGTYSTPDWLAVFGKAGLMKSGAGNNEAGTITSYDISCYPNPFNPATTIRYQLPKDGLVTLKIYSAAGNEVKTLVNEFKSAGLYETHFDGSGLASGIYFYRIKVNDFAASKKLILLK